LNSKSRAMNFCDVKIKLPVQLYGCLECTTSPPPWTLQGYLTYKKTHPPTLSHEAGPTLSGEAGPRRAAMLRVCAAAGSGARFVFEEQGYELL